LFGVEECSYNALIFYNLPSEPGSKNVNITSTYRQNQDLQMSTLPILRVTAYFNNSDKDEKSYKNCRKTMIISKPKRQRSCDGTLGALP